MAVKLNQVNWVLFNVIELVYCWIFYGYMDKEKDLKSPLPWGEGFGGEAGGGGEN